VPCLLNEDLSFSITAYEPAGQRRRRQFSALTARRATLACLRELVAPTPPANRQDVDRYAATIELYRLVEMSPGLPFNTTAMVQYGAAVLGTLLAYLLG
jgi:hypothetical protein